MGTFTWETLEPWKPFLSDIYLGTSEFIDIARYAGVDGYCLPAPARVPFLLGGCPPAHEPLLGNLGNRYLGNSGTFELVLGDLYLGTSGFIDIARRRAPAYLSY